MNTAQNSRFFKIGEAAKLLGLSAETLRRWERSGKITFSRTPGGKRLFSEADLEAVKNLLKPTHEPQIQPEITQESQKNIDKTNEKNRNTSLQKSTFPKPNQSLSQFIKFFVVLALIIGNITFFLQTPYSPILMANLRVAQEQGQSLLNAGHREIQSKYETLKTQLSKNLEQDEKILKVAEIPQVQKTVLAEQSDDNGDLAISGLLATSQSLYSPTNLIINSSFEGGVQGYSIIGQSTDANTRVGIESVRSGTQALKISDNFCIGCQLGISQVKVQTINGRNYVLSVYVRVKDLIGSPKLRIGLFGTVSTSDPLYLSQPENYLSYSQDRYEDHSLSNLPENEWVRLYSTFENLPLGKYPIIEVIDYQGGTVYIDDLSQNEAVSEVAISPLFPQEQNNAKLGDNAIIADSFGNLYPNSPFSGSLGIDGTRFASLYLTKLTIDSGGNLATSGNISAKDITLTGTFTNSGSGTFSSLTVTGNINSDDGALQTNGVTRIDNSGNLTAGTGSFSGNVLPGLDATYNFGSESVRWLNGYFSGDVVVGDAVFKNDFRLTEGLRFGKHSIDMLNPKGEMIASFDEDGNFWVKGEIRQWKKN